MSFPTKPAFIHKGNWDDETRKHPAMKFMEEYTVQIIDKKKFDEDYSIWNTSDFTVFKSDGQTVCGGQDAWDEVARIYAPLTSHTHEPYFAMCSETSDGYEMIGQAYLYATLPGEPASGEKKVKSLSGKEWDVKVPSGFHFWYVKDENAKNGHGFLLKRTEIMSDSGPIMMAMLKRGVIKPGDLGL